MESVATPNSRVELPRTTPEVLAACAQALRTIRARGEEVQTIGVTSALRGEGRSTIAAGMAISDVRSLGRRAVLVELDTEQWPAATPSKDGEAGPPSRIWELVDWSNGDLGVLRLAGRTDATALTRAQVGRILAELLEHDVDIVGDLGCLPPKGAGDQFAGLFDVTVLVVRAGSTSEDAVRSAALTLIEPPVVLLNRVTSAIPRWLRGTGR